MTLIHFILEALPHKRRDSERILSSHRESFWNQATVEAEKCIRLEHCRADDVKSRRHEVDSCRQDVLKLSNGREKWIISSGGNGAYWMWHMFQGPPCSCRVSSAGRVQPRCWTHVCWLMVVTADRVLTPWNSSHSFEHTVRGSRTCWCVIHPRHKGPWFIDLHTVLHHPGVYF